MKLLSLSDLNFRSILIPIARLGELRADLAAFKELERINSFQTWIVDHLYNWEPPTGFPIRSMLLIALPHPMYSPVTLVSGGRKVECLSLVSSDFDGARKTVEEAARVAGVSLVEARNLPLKRLAVRSGLSMYGRNNVTYIDGLGSSFSYLAYFTDQECSDDRWTEVRQSPRCEKCAACRTACPTGAILADRFLIDNERCLSCLNETGEPFPAWLVDSVHHTLYDCLKCQLACPMNRDRISDVGEHICFDEAETALLLAGTRYGDYPATMQRKAKYLGLDQWPDGIAKNVRTLFSRHPEVM